MDDDIWMPLGAGMWKQFDAPAQVWWTKGSKWAQISRVSGQVVEAKVTYRTQKARDLEAGWALSSHAGFGYKIAPNYGVLPHMSKADVEALTFPKFARPCPLKPRHGFVESRDVKNIHELEALFKETREHDPEGELIVMDRLSGKYSAVITAAGCAWGLSNDGITSGKGESFVIPTPAGKFDTLLLPYLGIRPPDFETNGLYAELVEDRGSVCVVQMRLGPKQPDSRVKRVTVGLSRKIAQILRPETDDLIEWDRVLKASAPMAERVLVWLPGQTMSSHFAVQGIANGYNVSVEDECPVKTDGTPQEAMLKPDTAATAPLKKADYAKLAELFERDKKIRFWDFPRDVLLTVGVLHSLPYWDNAPHLLALRARGVMLAARYGLAACLGEARHRPRRGQNAKVPWHKLLDTKDDDFRPSRSYVFVRAFGMPWEMGAELALLAAEDMRLEGQPPVMEYLAKGGKLGDHSASFMGQKWEWAALRVHDLHVSIDRFCKDANKDNWNVILGHYNEIINAAHNCGYLLNKWCSPNLIDNAASAPALVFGFRNVMNLIWGNHKPDEPRVAWLPMSQKPAEPGYFVEVGENVLVPSIVWKQMEVDGIVEAEQCKCKICMKPKWESIGMAAIAQGLPCYVPDDKIVAMPQLSSGDKEIEELTKPVEKVDTNEYVDDDVVTLCPECESELVEGDCSDDSCELCPDYMAPTLKQKLALIKAQKEKADGDEVSEV